MRHLVGLLAIGLLATSAYAVTSTEPVADFQAFLNDRGCDVGTADGHWGKATTRGAVDFAALSGISIERPVSAELLLQLAASPARCDTVPPILPNLLPADILAASAAFKEEYLQCPVNTINLEEIQGLEPEARIKGLQSNYNNKYDVSGFRSLETMAAGMSGFYARALLSYDRPLKRALIAKLAEWARASAYEKTIDCSPQSGRNCGQPWQTSSGDDLAPSYDFLFVQNSMLHLGIGYYAALADFEPEELLAEHKAIRKWLDVFYRRLQDSAEVYFGFGMGFQWANLVAELKLGQTEQFQARLQSLADGLDANLLADGSLKDRTTRGARATGYHFGALAELMISLEILKANGIDLYPNFAERLHKSARIFLDAIDDPTTIYPWAKVNLESPGDYKTQEFTVEGNLRWAQNGTSWLYIYSYRFPDDDQTPRIRALLEQTGQLHDQDTSLGIGLQCLYLTGLPELAKVQR